MCVIIYFSIRFNQAVLSEEMTKRFVHKLMSHLMWLDSKLKITVFLRFINICQNAFNYYPPPV